MTEPVFVTDATTALRQAVADVFAVEAVMMDAVHRGVVHLYGRFLTDSATAYPIVRDRFHTLGYTAVFQQEEGRYVIRAMPGQLPTAQPNLRIAGILLALTVASTLFVSMEWQEGRPLLQNLFSGLPYALPLMAILLAHELGHYLVARHFGVPVTLPYFIPLPLPPLGTMGAFIQMKAPPQNRRHLLAVGVAGPLAGLILAVPLLLVGLSLSTVAPVPTEPYLLEGNSVLYALSKIAQFGRFLPNNGVDVMLHPIAFAAWAGILVTGLNLIPAGTLDGGHVAYALLGKWATYLTWALIGALALLGILWTGWFLWAGLIFLLGRRSAVPLDDITQLEPWQVALGCLVMLVFVLTFTPIPMMVIQP